MSIASGDRFDHHSLRKNVFDLGVTVRDALLMDVAQELVREGVREFKLEIGFEVDEDEGEDETA